MEIINKSFIFYTRSSYSILGLSYLFLSLPINNNIHFYFINQDYTLLLRY